MPSWSAGTGSASKSPRLGLSTTSAARARCGSSATRGTRRSAERTAPDGPPNRRMGGCGWLPRW
eukprot:844167-Alexandrium_andersonii.AAC.1